MFINPCFITPCFITPCFINSCFRYHSMFSVSLHVLLIQCMFYQSSPIYVLSPAAHFFVHFFAVVVARLARETSWLHVLWTNYRMFSPTKNVVVFLFAFFLSAVPLIFTLLAANISHFVTADIVKTQSSSLCSI